MFPRSHIYMLIAHLVHADNMGDDVLNNAIDFKRRSFPVDNGLLLIEK